MAVLRTTSTTEPSVLRYALTLRLPSPLVAAMRKANYNSVRGKFQFNVNQHPIQDFYLLQAVKANNKDGAAMHIVQKAFEKHKDAYFQDCKMKW